MSALALRPYQTEAVDAVFREHENGVRRQLIHMATGLGKTCVALSVVRRWMGREHVKADPTRVLWLTHRDELVQQTLKAVSLWVPEFDLQRAVGVVKAEQNELDRLLVVASVQTLAVETRLAQLLESQFDDGRFGLVICDEAHLSAAPTWVRTLEALGCGEPDGPLLVGLTATPNRSDGVGLNVNFDKIVASNDIIWGVANGYLVPPVGITVKVDLSDVKISRGDYTDGSLSDVLELDGAHIAIARLIQEHIPERKTICFTPTVRFAALVAEECTKLGIAAETVSGETPLPDRHQMYDRLRSGATRVIVNCSVLQEGFDDPGVDAIVNARPTRSATTFTQRVGRGLRLYPGKLNCMVVALAGSERNKLATLASLAGRSWEDAMKARELKTDDEELFDFAAEFDAMIRDEAERAKLKSRPVDLLSAVRNKITWAVIDNHCYARSIPDDDRRPFLVVKESWRQDGWRVVGGWTDPGTKNVRTKVLLEGVDFATAQAFADDEIRRRVPANLLKPDARWRRYPATDTQKNAMRKWKLPVMPGMTSGQASDALEAAFLKRAASAA